MRDREKTGRPVSPLVAKRAWNRRTVFSGLCDAWIRADCSNSSSCWERLVSSDSKTSTCKNKTRNLCFPPPSLPLPLSLSRSLHIQQHWEGMYFGNRLWLVRVSWKWHRPDHEPLRRVTAGAAAVRKHSSVVCVREIEKERLCFLLIGSCLPPPTTLKPHNTRGQRATGPACGAFLAFQSYKRF